MEAAFATCVAYGSLVFGVWKNFSVGGIALKASAIIVYALLIFSQVFHIRAMVQFFPWTKFTFHAYKAIRVLAVVIFLIVEAWSEYIELKPAVVFVIVTLEYLHQLFEYVSEGFEEWEHHKHDTKEGDNYYNLA